MRDRFLQWIKDSKLKFLSVLSAIAAAALDKDRGRLAGGAQSLPNSCFRAMGARNQVRSLSLGQAKNPVVNMALQVASIGYCQNLGPAYLPKSTPYLEWLLESGDARNEHQLHSGRPCRRRHFGPPGTPFRNG